MELMVVFLVWLMTWFASSELDAWLPWLSKRLVRARAKRLPAGLSDRMEEEWLGEIAARPGHVWKIVFALGLFFRHRQLNDAANDRLATRDVTIAVPPAHLSIAGAQATVIVSGVLIAAGSSSFHGVGASTSSTRPTASMNPGCATMLNINRLLPHGTNDDTKRRPIPSV